MRPEAAIDNDVLIKIAAYRLAPALADLFGGDGSIGVLGAARFVVPSAIDRHRGLSDRQAARSAWDDFLPQAQELEPTPEEVDLATVIEEHAGVLNLPLDGGESQLCAMAIFRAIPRVVTGDKRAISAVEVAKDAIEKLQLLADRLVCLEQLMIALIERLGAEEVRQRVCAEPGVDKAIAICMGCSSYSDGSAFDQTGLDSYVAAVRDSASTMLATQPFP